MRDHATYYLTFFTYMYRVAVVDLAQEMEKMGRISSIG